MVYLAAKTTVSVNLDKLTAPAVSGKATATWIDPRTGNSLPAGNSPAKGAQEFSTPQGWEDALLVLE